MPTLPDELSTQVISPGMVQGTMKYFSVPHTEELRILLTDEILCVETGETSLGNP